jgi:hypothetical protein
VLWVTYETVDHAGRTAVYYAGRMRHELVHYIWGPQPIQAAPNTAGHTPGALTDSGDGGWPAALHHEPGSITVGLEPRWDWRRARSRAAAAADALGCWAVGTPAALAPLDAQADGDHLYGARYLHWGARLGQLLNRPRLRLRGRDIGAPNTSKAVAAAWLCEHLGIEPGETAAFGDGDNDLELLAFAATSVGMANATPRVLQLVSHVAPPNHDDGVAQVLRHWLQAAP